MTDNVIPDCVFAKQLLKDTFEKLRIESTRSLPVFSTVSMFDNKMWPHFTYSFTFVKNGHMLSEIYHCGASREEITHRDFSYPNKDRIPTHEKVPANLCADAYEARNQPFEDWADNFGYNSDSIKAKKIYDKCSDLWHSLCKILTQPQIQQLAELHYRL